MTVNILVGDALLELRKLPADSVHCVVTSPPYWGLRDYGIPPSVWGGDDDCQHDFVDETIERELRRGVSLEGLSKRYRGGGKKAALCRTLTITRGVCMHCGAWRGAIGLEPTPEMFVDHMVGVFEEVRRVLRPDGTLWLNIGDSYASATQKGNSGDGGSTLTGGIKYQDDAPRPAITAILPSTWSNRNLRWTVVRRDMSIKIGLLVMRR